MKKFSIFIGFYLLILPIYASSELQKQQKILHYVNLYRTKHGLKPLELNETISLEAEKHSKDMATHRMGFGHQGFPSRVGNLYRKIPNCNGAAENVAFNYKDLKNLVYLWTKSPGHKQNIIGSYNLTGIGIAYDSNGKPYYTQMFIRKK